MQRLKDFTCNSLREKHTKVEVCVVHKTHQFISLKYKLKIYLPSIQTRVTKSIMYVRLSLPVTPTQSLTLNVIG